MKRISYGAFERLTAATGISRSSIAEVLAQAHGPWLLHLGSRERISILEHMAAMYGILGYQRKEAYILREVLGCVMDMIVIGREASGGPNSRIAGAGLGIQGVDAGGGAAQGFVGIRTNDSTVGNESVLRVVKHICLVHGVDLEAVKLEVPPDPADPPSTTADTTAELDTLQEPFGWPELQIGIVREAIAVAEALPGSRSLCSHACMFHSRIFNRLPLRGAVLTLSLENVASRDESRRPTSAVQHCISGLGHCKTSR